MRRQNSVARISQEPVKSKEKYLFTKLIFLVFSFYKTLLPRPDDEPPQKAQNKQIHFPRRVTGAERVREWASGNCSAWLPHFPLFTRSHT
jgi:hypothetical protein